MTGVPDVEDYFNLLDELNFTFERQAGDVPADFVGQPTDLDNDTTGEVFGGVNLPANNFFFSLYQTIVPGTGPASFANFEAKESWRALIESISEATGSSQTYDGTAGDEFQGPLYEVFINHFKIQYGIPFDESGDLGDFETLYQALGTAQTRKEFLDEVFANSMTYFLTHYDFTIPDAAKLALGGPDPDFDWIEEFAKNVSMFFESRAALDTDAFSLGSSVNLVMYEKVFNEFVPQPPIKSFEEVLKEFYNEIVDRDRFFLPSHQLKDWIDKVQERQVVESNTISSVTGTKSERTAILLILFRLLVEVIDVLQRVAAAQGERLSFYAGFQKAYTDLIAQMPIINRDDVEDSVRTGNESKFQEITSFTQSQNQAFTERLRSFRSVLGDEAKQHQTSVNQSNEIVTQQANLGTSILQQLSTILTNLFK